MVKELMYWDIYEISTEKSQITGVKIRGRIRKLCLENKRNVLAENCEKNDNLVRFAIPNKEDPKLIIDYLKNILSDVKIKLVKEKIANPILSKLKVNIEERYTL
ncbi:MAG: hypothetical protein ACMXX8_01915 [Candidatus Woesearchaeota archaeon]